jgi:integrase
MRKNGTITQRSDGYFRIRYNLGTNPLTGKRKRGSVTVKGKRHDAERELRRLLSSLDNNDYVEPNKIIVRDFLKQWLEMVHTQITPKSHEGYSEIVNNYLVPTFGGSHLAKLAPAAIQQAYNGWEKSGRKDKREGGLSARSRLFIHRVLKSALKHAVQLQLIARNPADVVKAPRIKKAAITTLTIEQSAILLNALQDTRLYWPVLIALTTGMRRGEILALRWKNVDFEKKTVRVVESLEQTNKGVRFKAPKTERSRAILLPEYTVEELKLWKEKQTKELKELHVVSNSETLVCARQDGEPLWPTSLTHEFVKAIRKLPSLPRVRFHDLRHSHATQLLTSGIHPKIAQERLGHTTITTTLDLYSHATDTMQDEAAAKLNSALRFAIKPRPNRGPQLG